MRKHKDFMSEPDYGYIDIESCFEPIFEPPVETLEEWRSLEDEPESTLENGRTKNRKYLVSAGDCM